jgi:hypothetical protein
MKRGSIRCAIAIILCIAFCAGAVSALDGYWQYYQGKQSILQSYQKPSEKPVPGTGGSISGTRPVLIGTLPRFIRAGDTVSLNIYGDVQKGQTISFSIENGRFTTGGEEFVFNITTVVTPAVADSVSTSVAVQPVSWLRIERMEGGEIATMESSSPDANGKITLAASGIEEDTQVYDYMSVTGTPTLGTITMNGRLEGVLVEDLHNPTFQFHVEAVEKGSFTAIISVGGSEKLRQTIFVF